MSSVAEINIRERSWIADYVEHTTRLVEHHGGRYLARTASFEKVEGERPPAQIYLLIEWPSKEAATTFYDSDEYRIHRERRCEGSQGEFVLVAGEDINGVAHM